MKTRATFTICAVLIANMLVGCSSFKSLAFNDVDPDDPLAVERRISPTYKLAKRELDKSAATTVMKFARWREDLDDYEEAKRQYMDVLADDPENIEARLGVARVEFKTGHKAEAEKILAATTRKFPNATNAWVEMGRVYSSQEKWDKAVTSFQSAVKTDSSSRLANYELGVALARTDQLDDAHRHLAVAGGDSAAFYNVGYILHEAGRSQDAADWTRKALASKPDQNTQASAEKLLATLGRTLSTPADGTMLAGNPQPSFVNQQKTTYRHFTESPNADGFVPASMTVQQSAAETVTPAVGHFGISGQNNSRINQRSNGPTTAFNAGSTVGMPSSRPIHTANLQKGGNTPPQQDWVPQWNGPTSAGNQPMVTPAHNGMQNSEPVQPQAWRSL